MFPGNESAPQAEVGDRRSFERRAFAIELARVHGAGRRVERHVEEHRAAARGQRTAAGGRAFPFGAPGSLKCRWTSITAGKNGQPARVDFFASARKLRADRLNAAVFDRDVGRSTQLPVTNVPPRMTRSAMRALQFLEKRKPAASAAATSSSSTASVRMMADAAGTRAETASPPAFVRP